MEIKKLKTAILTDIWKKPKYSVNRAYFHKRIGCFCLYRNAFNYKNIRLMLYAINKEYGSTTFTRLTKPKMMC